VGLGLDEKLDGRAFKLQEPLFEVVAAGEAK
jgi:hypothetical protein